MLKNLTAAAFLVRAGYLLILISATASASGVNELKPRITEAGLTWEGEAVTFTYTRHCRVVDYTIVPYAKCFRDHVGLASQLLVNDQSLIGRGNRKVQMEDMSIWVDGAKMRNYNLSNEDELANALEASESKYVKVSIPRQIGGMDGPTYSEQPSPPRPEPRVAQYVLSDFEAATKDYSSMLYDQSRKDANELTAMRAAGAVLVLLTGVILIRKAMPTVRRGSRSIMRASVGARHMNYNRKLNKRIEEMRLQEEAEKCRDADRKRHEYSDDKR